TIGFSGVDSFTYSVTNALGDVDTATVTVRVIQPVQIDIKPGETINAINVGSNGQITVTLFSTAAFNAAAVDVASVLFAGAAAIQSSRDDVDHDGDLDLVLHFRIQDTNLRDVYRQLLLDDFADGTLDSTRQTAEL